MYYLPNSYTTHAEHEWAGVTFLRQLKKVSPAHALQVYLEEQIGYPAHNGLISPSVNYENMSIFNVGIKIRVSTWSHLSILHSLEISIATCHHVLYTKYRNKTKNHFPPQPKNWHNGTTGKKFLKPMCSKCRVSTYHTHVNTLWHIPANPS